MAEVPLFKAEPQNQAMHMPVLTLHSQGVFEVHLHKNIPLCFLKCIKPKKTWSLKKKKKKQKSKLRGACQPECISCNLTEMLFQLNLCCPFHYYQALKENSVPGLFSPIKILVYLNYYLTFKVHLWHEQL